MNALDLVTMLDNISTSLGPVQTMIGWGAFILGVVFVITALQKLYKLSDHRAGSSSREKLFTPMMYLLGGTVLIFLPSALSSFAATFFGAGNILSYAPPKNPDIYTAMGYIIRTAGLIWFVRGTTLLVHSSAPGTQQGPKGLVFLIAGVMAVNFDNTIAVFNAMFTYVTDLTTSVVSRQGY